MKTGREIKEAALGELNELSDDTEYCTAEEFAGMYGYNPNSLRTMLMRGKISGAIKVRNHWLFARNADILVKQNTKKCKIKM